MPAYMLVQALISDGERYGQYRQAVMPVIDAFGGKHVRGGKVVQLEGRAGDRRISLFEFPSIEDIHAFWKSPQYVPIKALRAGAADLEIWAVPGL